MVELVDRLTIGAEPGLTRIGFGVMMLASAATGAILASIWVGGASVCEMPVQPPLARKFLVSSKRG